MESTLQFYRCGLSIYDELQYDVIVVDSALPHNGYVSMTMYIYNQQKELVKTELLQNVANIDNIKTKLKGLYPGSTITSLNATYVHPGRVEKTLHYFTEVDFYKKTTNHRCSIFSSEIVTKGNGASHTPNFETIHKEWEKKAKEYYDYNANRNDDSEIVTKITKLKNELGI